MTGTYAKLTEKYVIDWDTVTELSVVTILAPEPHQKAAVEVWGRDLDDMYEVSVGPEGVTVPIELVENAIEEINLLAARIERMWDELKGISQKHVYASFYRPISAMWARYPGLEFRDSSGYRQYYVPYTYAVISEKMDADQAGKWELEYLGFKP